MVFLKKLVVVVRGAIAGLTHSRYALDRNLSNAVSKAREARIRATKIFLSFFNKLLNHLFLLLENEGKVHVLDSRIKFAAHECGTLIFFDVSMVGRSSQRNLSAETLLLKIARGELVRIREKM